MFQSLSRDCRTLASARENKAGSLKGSKDENSLITSQEIGNEKLEVCLGLEVK